ncbi:MAG: Lrp/AsnC ligand binding domain-containing protein [Candidatus Nitrosotenuis sp.]
MTNTAYVLISCIMGEEHYVLEQIRLIQQVKTAVITYGEYDLVAKIQTESAQEMASIISSQIRQIQKIRSTITLHVI